MIVDLEDIDLQLYAIGIRIYANILYGVAFDSKG